MTARSDAPQVQESVTVYDDSLAGAARFAEAVLGAQLQSMGKYEPKLVYTAWKKLVAVLEGSGDREPAARGFVPLSVRHGSLGKRLRWKLGCLRERLALRLAPWLTPPRLGEHLAAPVAASGSASSLPVDGASPDPEEGR